ncbi:MbnP family protein [Gaetbulibacter aestuarii]|uniref:MbnP family protein n=1 Tax=Gaetbulibacter aestuarii TaxID=1502358 RepID=A0ABW7MW55_9FLAO
MNKESFNKVIVILYISMFWSCSSNSDLQAKEVQVSFNFSSSWRGVPVTNADFNDLKYTNTYGTSLSLSKLRYLISNIRFTNTNGDIIHLPGYQLIDITENKNLSLTPEQSLPTGKYTQVSFTFGFTNGDNYNKSYPDLNAASWNVPEMLGGGYHFMQMEGKFLDDTNTEISYAMHMIRAVDNNLTPMRFEDTFFTVNLGPMTISDNTTIYMDMNIAAWFDSPNTWNLNDLNNMMMPNFNAQLMLFENGQNVFHLNHITP